MATSHPKLPLTQRLLERAHSPTTAAQIHATKFVHKPLHLLPTTSKDNKATTPKKAATDSAAAGTTDARTLRREQRKAQTLEKQAARKKGKGSRAGRVKPLSAAEKRKLCLYEIPKAERKYEIYTGLNRLWCKYIREILGLKNPSYGYVTGASGGAVLASADFHGAEVEVVRGRCVGRVGTRGIVVRDTMFTFVVITKANEVKSTYFHGLWYIKIFCDTVGLGGSVSWLTYYVATALPKEHTIFRFEVPLVDGDDDKMQEDDKSGAGVGDSVNTFPPTAMGTTKPRSLVFELHGEQFKNRAPDRANKKFKMHLPEDL